MESLSPHRRQVERIKWGIASDVEPEIDRHPRRNDAGILAPPPFARGGSVKFGRGSGRRGDNSVQLFFVRFERQVDEELSGRPESDGWAGTARRHDLELFGPAASSVGGQYPTLSFVELQRLLAC